MYDLIALIFFAWSVLGVVGLVSFLDYAEPYKPPLYKLVIAFVIFGPLSWFLGVMFGMMYIITRLLAWLANDV